MSGSTSDHIHCFIAADVGGTNARFRVVKRSTMDELYREVVLFKVFPVEDYDSIESIIAVLMSILKGKGETPRVITLAIAGVLENNCIECTNVPRWPIVDANALKKKFGFKQFHLLNDFEANGYATCAVNVDENSVVIQEGDPVKKEPKIVVGPGTGLGCALVVYNEEQNFYTVVRSEGGHTEFTVTNEEELKLRNFALRYIAQHHKNHPEPTRVSTERLAAGPAIPLMYEFFREEYPELEVVCQPDPKTNTFSGKDVVKACLSKGDPLASKVVKQFVKNLAIFTSDIALVAMARGGVYLTGGVSEVLAECIKSNHFLDIMHDKGRLSSFLKKVPVYFLKGQPGLDGSEQFCLQNFCVSEMHDS